jgi:hypothetical protein
MNNERAKACEQRAKEAQEESGSLVCGSTLEV